MKAISNKPIPREPLQIEPDAKKLLDELDSKEIWSQIQEELEPEIFAEERAIAETKIASARHRAV